MIFYAGNYLSEHGFTPTGIEFLTPKLSQRYKILSVSNKKKQIFRLWDMINSFLKNKEKIKLVLIDSYSMRAFWYTYILSKLCISNDIPYITILHGGGYPDRLKKSPKKCKYIFSHSLKNISPSLYLKKYFEKEGYEVEYIPNFIPIENYEFKKRSHISPKLFWVRSFHKIYNPLLALEILQKLKKKFADAELCMVGPDKDGTLQEFIDKAKEAGLYDSVKLTGLLSRNEWIELSKSYDIFINTTNFDNHPVSVIEAMAVGLPVISTNVGGIPFLIEDNVDGILVTPNNSDRFVEEIEKLISQKDMIYKLTINARKKAEEFDWEVIKHKWFDIIDNIIKE